MKPSTSVDPPYGALWAQSLFARLVVSQVMISKGSR